MNELFIPWAKPVLWGKEQEYLTAALTSTWISGGEFVDRLQSEFAAYSDAKHAFAVCNGTAALHLAFLAANLRAGDEVVVPGFAFQAAANVALLMGARPVFAEVDPDTWCLTAPAVERCLTPRTRAVVPVHTYGNVCAMDDILALARERQLTVIEDAAEAFPSRYKGKLAGTLGTIGCFSFQATKTITTGEGGMVVTNEARASELMTLYRSHGMLRKRYYWHELPGHNFRLTNLQAAIGCAQLEKLDAIIGERDRVNNRYRAELSRVAGTTLQRFASDVTPVVWAIAVQLDPKAFPQGRDAVMLQMSEAGIETRPGFYAASQMEFYHCPPLPVCDQLGRQVMSLPSYPTLEDEQIDFICDRLARLRR
jgi:perosamine synthetase